MMKRTVWLGLLTSLVVALVGHDGLRPTIGHRVTAQFAPVPYDGLIIQYLNQPNWLDGLSSPLPSASQFNGVLDTNPNLSDTGESRYGANDRPTTPPAMVGEDVARAMTFRVSVANREQAIDRYVKQVHPSDRAAQQAFRQDLNNLFQAIGPALASYGLDANNLADAYTVYWINAWQGSRGRNDDLTAAQIAGVREQVLRAFSTTPAVMVTSDVEKQAMAEGFLVQATLIATSVEQAQNNPELMRSIQLATRQGAMTVGLDLDRMALTEQGFILQ